MPQLNASELEKALEQVFQFMEKKGIKIDNDKKNEICKEMVDALYHKLSPEDIKEPNVQKRLISCISAKLAGDHKAFENTLDELKDDDVKNTDDKHLDKKLGVMLLMLLSLQMKNRPAFSDTIWLQPEAPIQLPGLNQFSAESPAGMISEATGSVRLLH